MIQDGATILFSARVRETEPAEAQAPKGYKPPLVINKVRHKFDGEGYFDDKRRHLFVIPAAGGEARQITAAIGMSPVLHGRPMVG